MSKSCKFLLCCYMILFALDFKGAENGGSAIQFMYGCIKQWGVVI